MWAGAGFAVYDAFGSRKMGGEPFPGFVRCESVFVEEFLGTGENNSMHDLGGAFNLARYDLLLDLDPGRLCSRNDTMSL